MGLAEFTGLTPTGYDEGTRIERVSRHHRWDVDREAWSDCTNCGSELRLRDRHLLVRLGPGRGHEAGRVHVCDERCLAEWVGQG
ncbi:hypothetical protein ACFO0N_12390 [Halobium salinum]|uniref:Small CPxCG-related zinc finger protein n=1 Tax=Halobium salinum TaxID=1364940 RepID=A0ABD5PDA6_9EURY|nr:hypothetical protein [Halobium salinum]